MGCTGTGKATEYEFVVSCRDRGAGQCRGPLVTLTFDGYQLTTLEDSLGSEIARDVLWHGFQPELSPDRVAFGLCAAHWMDLAYLAGYNAREQGRREWMQQASSLLDQLFAAEHWDHKEMSNMLIWRRGAAYS